MKKPIYKTAPYLQKVMTRYPIDSDIRKLTVISEDLLYAASSNGLHKLEKGVWSTVLDGETAVKEGLIDNIGNLKDALSYLYSEINKNNGDD